MNDNIFKYIELAITGMIAELKPVPAEPIKEINDVQMQMLRS